MKLQGFILSLILSAGLFPQIVQAYEAGLVEETCRKAKFTNFSLPEYHAKQQREVPAQSSFSLVISPWIDPNSVKLFAKRKPLAFTLLNKNSFYVLTSQLPAAYNGQFVRLDIQVKALLGCKSQDGWLIKVAN
ncbi:MAG: hypothetical protein RL637_1580 [Pseudomonadota bacterium]|jgi:hypothetical protein